MKMQLTTPCCERNETPQQEKMGAESALFSCERIYRQIIKFLCGWMQHNDCVIMQIIAFPLVLGQIGRQARPYQIPGITSGTLVYTQRCLYINSLLCEWLLRTNNIIRFLIRKMSSSGFITIGKHLSCSDQPCRLYHQSNMRFEGVNDAPLLHLVCGCIPLSGEVH